MGGKDDLVVVGVSSAEGLLAVGMSDLRNARLLYRPSKDGADLALQGVLDGGEQLEARFALVHVASGDGGAFPVLLLPLPAVAPG